MSFDIEKITTQFSKVPGVLSVALGGSQSRNEADPQSDYDIGVYYNRNEIDLVLLQNTLNNLDDDHRKNILNSPGEWGQWINGGSWLTVDDTNIDILLRDTARVKSVLQDCLLGKVTIDYQCGHPFGFVNSIYAAETHFCVSLWQDSSNSPTV